MNHIITLANWLRKANVDHTVPFELLSVDKDLHVSSCGRATGAPPFASVAQAELCLRVQVERVLLPSIQIGPQRLFDFVTSTC